VKHHSSRDTAADGASSKESEARTPGKQTLTSHVQLMPAESEPAAASPLRRLQLRGAEPAAGASGQSFVDGISGVHAAAAAGVSGPSSAMPHQEAIQQSFGRHDISGIAAHTDDKAAAGANAMGASAFATGNHVAFAGAPSLHTAAHEAAHVVQQRAGVHLAGGVGAAGDPHERHADAVADRVVQGQSAEGLLDQYAGGGGAGGSAIQRQDAGATGGAAAVDYDAEFNSFSQRGHIEGGLEGYKDIRELFISEFGSVAKANAYYSAMSHPFFLGQKVTVHQQLADALAAAEVKLGQGSSDPAEQQQYEAIAAAVKDGFTGPSAGGFNIRRNRNAKGRLSDHSFGTAIDIRAKFNPNLAEDKKRRAAQKKNPSKPERFDEKMIVAVTDRNIGSDLARMREGGKTDDLVDPAADIHGASEDFKAAFADEGAVEHAMREYLTRLSIDIKDDFTIDKVKDAAKGGKAGKAGFKELSHYLSSNLGSMPDAIEQQEREDRESFFANGGTEKRWKELEKQRLDASLKKSAADRARLAAAYRKDAELTAKGVSDDEIQKRVWDPFWAGEGKRFEADVSAITDRAAQMLIKMWSTYQQSLQTGKQDKDGDGRRDPQTEGEPGTIAAHGFMDLPAKLVAAMSGSDGGNLKWLGAYNQDFMHFELKATPPRK
jgi:hypothetical protein